ncbi:MAG: discoidin domain-containing protein [Polyangiaceae bacterium]|nr:discoidin domain-containing protein [Polyangiaceae bacterium]
MAGLARRLGEPLWLGLALERARAFDGPHASRARALAAAARRRATAARSLTSDEQDVAALRLCHEAAALALAALAATRGELDDPLPSASALWAGAADLPGRPQSFAAAQALLATDDLVAFDALPDPRRARLTIAPTLGWLLALAEPRTRRQLVLARVARSLGFVATVAGLSWLALWLLVFPANEARYKPAVLSSLARGSAPTEALTDGAGERACSTDRQSQPWARVDLLNHVAIDSVRVHVRSDTSLPLVLEVSDDDRRFREVSVRHEPVATGRWRVALGKQRARFVRVRHPGDGALSLSELEVWGWR